MNIEELKEKFNIDEDLVTELGKVIQGAEDKVRTDYSIKLKNVQDELKDLKPKEKTEKDLEFEKTQNELNELKFKMAIKEKGLDDNMAKYLKSDIDLDEVSNLFNSMKSNKQDYIAKSHSANGGMTKDEFHALDYSEKAKLYSDNPTLYAELNK